MKKYIAFQFLTFLIVSSTVAQNIIKKEIISLKPNKNVSYGVFFKVLTFSTTENTEIDYIKDFDFEWGYEYQLKVKKEIIAQPMADASNVEYTLEKIMKKEKVEEEITFEMQVHKNLRLNSDFENTLKLKDDTTWVYFNDLEIIVLEDKRKEFMELDEQTAKFKFGADNKVYFVGK